MTDQNIDDGALAALIACLDPVAFPHEDYTTALSRAEGDVARAAEILLLGEGGSGSGGGGEVNGLIGGRQGKRRLEHYFSRPAKASRKAESELLSSASLSGDGSAEPSPTPTLDRAASASQWATLLRPPPPSKPAPTRSGPIHLTSPSAVAGADIPLAVLPSPLTPSQAAALYHEMLAESPAWPRNKWYLAGREVESNHQATSYSRPGGGFGSSGVPYFYASRKYNAKVSPRVDEHSLRQPYPLLLSQAAAAVEEVVNAHLATLPRFAWEYRGKWRANMCAANRYDGAQAT
jgi:hypothetical protein